METIEQDTIVMCEVVPLNCPYTSARLFTPVLSVSCATKHPFRCISRNSVEAFMASPRANGVFKCAYCGINIYGTEFVIQIQLDEILAYIESQDVKVYYRDGNYYSDVACARKIPTWVVFDPKSAPRFRPSVCPDTERANPTIPFACVMASSVARSQPPINAHLDNIPQRRPTPFVRRPRVVPNLLAIEEATRARELTFIESRVESCSKSRGTVGFTSSDKAMLAFWIDVRTVFNRRFKVEK